MQIQSNQPCPVSKNEGRHRREKGRDSDPGAERQRSPERKTGASRETHTESKRNIERDWSAWTLGTKRTVEL